MRTPFTILAHASPCVLALMLSLAPGPAQAKDTGLVFVSNEKTSDITVIDPTSMKAVNSIKTSRRPRDMHLNKDRTLLYVACGDDDVIDVIDVGKQAVVDHIPTGPSPEVFRL